MTCCVCEKYVCSSCGIICDGCGKYYTCEGECATKSRNAINEKIKGYDLLNDYRDKVYCGGCGYDVKGDIKEKKLLKDDPDLYYKIYYSY